MNYGYQTSDASSGYLNGALGMQQSQAIESRQTAMGEFSRRLEIMLNVIRDISGDVCSVADRALGPIPQSAEKSGPASVPNGVLATIAEQLTHVDVALGALREQVSRLHQIV